jgi:hypothetical protein
MIHEPDEDEVRRWAPSMKAAQSLGFVAGYTVGLPVGLPGEAHAALVARAIAGRGLLITVPTLTFLTELGAVIPKELWQVVREDTSQPVAPEAFPGVDLRRAQRTQCSRRARG